VEKSKDEVDSMSKIAKLIFFLCVFLLVISSINAQVTPQRDFASVQAQILANIEKVNAKLDNVESNIANSNADQSVKDKAIA
jgi:sensor domain CHASE-containing protein